MITGRVLSLFQTVARGFFTQGQGNPDESRASRYILKDYVNAKLLYCHPPPNIDADEFNAETRDIVKLALSHKLRTKRAPATRVGKKSDTFIELGDSFSDEDDEGDEATDGVAEVDVEPSLASVNTARSSARPKQSARANALDRNFFTSTNIHSRPFMNGVAANASGETGRNVMYPHQRQLENDGTRLSSRKIRELENLGAIQLGGKKHYKGNRRQKARSGAGYEV